MRKGKFGVVLCLYPIVGFACVILNQPLLCAAVFALALIAERDPWAGRQTLQAFALSAVTAVLRSVLAFVVQLFPGDYYSWGVLRYLSVALGALSALVYLLAIVISVLAITRVMKDREAGLPLLSDLAYWAFGLRKPRPAPGPYTPPPFQQPGPGQPVPPPPQPGPAGHAPYPPYAPPKAPVPPQPGSNPQAGDHPRSKRSFFQLNRSPSACQRVEGFFLPF
mgnify:CR=1 FL=1